MITLQFRCLKKRDKRGKPLPLNEAHKICGGNCLTCIGVQIEDESNSFAKWLEELDEQNKGKKD